MNCKEYIASEGKVLFNIDTCTLCVKALCELSRECHFIEMTLSDGEYFSSLYQQKAADGDDEIKDEILNAIQDNGYFLNNLVEAHEVSL